MSAEGNPRDAAGTFQDRLENTRREYERLQALQAELKQDEQRAKATMNAAMVRLEGVTKSLTTAQARRKTLEAELKSCDKDIALYETQKAELAAKVTQLGQQGQAQRERKMQMLGDADGGEGGGAGAAAAKAGARAAAPPSAAAAAPPVDLMGSDLMGSADVPAPAAVAPAGPSADLMGLFDCGVGGGGGGVGGGVGLMGGAGAVGHADPPLQGFDLLGMGSAPAPAQPPPSAGAAACGGVGAAHGGSAAGSAVHSQGQPAGGGDFDFDGFDGFSAPPAQQRAPRAAPKASAADPFAGLGR